MDHALETRLARAALHEPTSLPALLAALEGADWALVLAGEDALFEALRHMGGATTVRADSRAGLSADVLADEGFTLATLDADWKGSLVWLLEPDDRGVKRAKKAEAPIVADVTWCPGGGALAKGASFAALRDAGALAGDASLRFSALLGLGAPPELTPEQAEPADALTVALVLRGLSTLGVRLARQTSAAQTLAERLGERAEAVTGSVLLVKDALPATSLFSTRALLGGPVSARQDVEGGILLSVGLESVEDLWRDLTGDPVIGEVKVVDEAPTQATSEPLVDEVPAVVPEVGPDDAPEEVSEEPVEELPEEAAPEQPLAPDLPPAPPRGESADPAEDLTAEQRAAYERLREWRNAEARRQEVSRFIVASNATLAEIARALPQTPAELRAVKGMGAERVRKYAEPILAMLSGMR